jgi:8-oxo-dGTP diphosphatase
MCPKSPGSSRRSDLGVTYDFPRPALTADAVVFRPAASGHEVLLIRRKHPPFEGCWAIPGGFLDESETLADCAARELAEETGLAGVALELLANFSTPGRDPRGWTVSAAYVGMALAAAAAQAGDDAAEARWFDADTLPDLAFDHAEILATARAWLKARDI